jgi:long-subunit acyl-CoA synthetase (AMP-forming)
VQAINRLNGVCVPLYDTLGDAAVEYVVRHAEIKLVVAQVRIDLFIVFAYLGYDGELLQSCYG